uniref:Synaptotagmin-5-like isoform X3 n=1 Tax=Phascolarctos cinereus TaxID=38626 RepID=A0A6P5KWY9_PHACI|nr:synaptotagmin-5-like isoform X3 [Phascolarctos cinereus]
MSMPAAGSWPRAPQAPGNPHHEQEAVSPQVFLGAGCTVLFSSLLLGCGFCWRWRQSPANLPTPAMVQVASDSLSGCLVSYTRELSTIKSKMQKSHSSQDLLVPGLRTPWMGSHGQLFLLLQYQATAHRIKVLVRKAENLHSLGQLPGHREHSVVIGLYQDGQLLDSRETQAIVGRSPVWNAPFLFSLPAGDLHEQSLFFQFTVMQRHLLTRTVTLGWVQIGPEAPAAGRAHWWDMYQHSLQESAQWHPLCPGKPDPPRAAASGSGTRNS